MSGLKRILKQPGRENLRLNQIVPVEKRTSTNTHEREPLPEHLRLPRTETRLNEKIPFSFHSPHYPIEYAPPNYPADAEPVTNRWRIGFTPWRRYTSGETVEMPYGEPPRLWHPYRQSLFKGDYPIIGQDIFLNLTAGSQTEFEARRLPTPSGVSANQSDSSEFFGQSEQTLVHQQRFTHRRFVSGRNGFPTGALGEFVCNRFSMLITSIRAETGQVRPSPARGTARVRSYTALQEASLELHLGDLSENYDFFAIKVGNQDFNSDFRGFIFNDINSRRAPLRQLRQQSISIQFRGASTCARRNRTPI